MYDVCIVYVQSVDRDRKLGARLCYSAADRNVWIPVSLLALRTMARVFDATAVAFFAARDFSSVPFDTEKNHLERNIHFLFA